MLALPNAPNGVPATLPPIYVAAAGENSAELAHKIGDGLISVEEAERYETQLRKEK